MARALKYIAYNERGVYGPFSYNEVQEFRKEKADEDFIVFNSKKPEKDMEYLEKTLSKSNQIKTGNMDLSIIQDEEEKQIIKDLADFPLIRKILKKYGITGCSYCSYSDREIAEWVLYNEKNGLI